MNEPNLEFPLFNIIKARPPGLVMDRLPGGGWKVDGNVCFVKKRDGVVQDIIEGTNKVTDKGDLYYAYRVALEQPTDALFTTGSALPFDGVMELYTGVTAAPSKSGSRASLTGGTLVTASEKVMDSGYPKRNDTDTNNTGRGADVLTYKCAYLTGDAISAVSITDLIITNPSPGASENLLVWTDDFTPFTKTGSDTLDAFVNHTINGV